METDSTLPAILDSVNQIKWMLAGILLIFIIGIGLIVTLAVGLFREGRKLAKEGNSLLQPDQRNNEFRKKAEDLLDGGMVDELMALAAAEHARYPDNLHVLHYLVMGHYRRKEFQQARVHLMRIKELYPPWIEYVDSFLASLPPE